MDPKLILTFIIILILVYFRFGSGSRLLKKKSHHYIEPPSPNEDPNWIPIEIDEYSKYIFFRQNNLEETAADITNVINTEFPKVKVDISLYNGWVKIYVLESNFSDFHKLISLCTFISGIGVVGYCKHKTTKEEDFIVKLDSDSGNDHMIGSFRTNQNFGIYLPKIDDNPKGNISKSGVKEIDFHGELSQVPIVQD